MLFCNLLDGDFMSSELINKPGENHSTAGHTISLNHIETQARQSVTRSTGIYTKYVKRILDILVALLLISIAFPIMAVVGLILAFRSGPVFFAHTRVGRQGRNFSCLKFRTMLPDAEQRLKELLDRDPAARQQWEASRKLDRDPRITPFGSFLRRSSLDELPQLFNVLSGTMSLVGPRPVPRAELELYGQSRGYYLAMTPGVTGLWQVSGRNQLSYDQRVALDRHYAENLSFGMDLSILVRTVGVVLKATGK